MTITVSRAVGLTAGVSRNESERDVRISRKKWQNMDGVFDLNDLSTESF